MGTAWGEAGRDAFISGPFPGPISSQREIQLDPVLIHDTHISGRFFSIQFGVSFWFWLGLKPFLMFIF